MANEVNNVAAALTTDTFTRAGFTFTWLEQVAGGGGTAYADAASYPFTADVTLYAQWTALPNHTVIFNNNGGTGSMANEVNNVAAALTTDTFTRAGFSFMAGTPSPAVVGRPMRTRRGTRSLLT